MGIGKTDNYKFYEGFEGEISERPYTNVVESGETWTGGNVIRVM